MAIYHCSIKIISRGKGKSAVAAAAYRSGEKLINNYDGITHDYTRKSGIAHTEILLPSHAPPDFQNRSALWNSVEKIEKSKNSQLAREIELAIPKELPPEQQIELVREYVKDNFVSAGMCADIAIHDKKDGNPHAHIMLTMRPLNENGEWGAKSKKEYITDKNGERIKLKNGNYKTKKVDTVDWNEQSKAELWRSKWAELANKYLEQNSIADRIDHRSFERQGTEQIPTIHLGVAASQMERKGITTERGNINREIKAHNKLLAQIKAKITSLKRWISEYISSAEKDTEKTDSLADLVSRADIITQNQWEKVRNLKVKSKTLLYLQNNGIDTAEQLNEKIDGLRNEYFSARRKIKSTERTLADLSERLKQADIYRRYKPIHKEYLSQKSKHKEEYYNRHTAELILYDTAVKFLKNVIVHGKLPTMQWQEQAKRLIIQKQSLYADMYRLRDEVKEIENVKKYIDSITPDKARHKSRDIDKEI